MSRATVAKRFALDQRTLQDWEQGRRRRDHVARATQTVIARNPEAATADLSSS